MAVARGLLDTSVFIASESGRPLNVSALPEEAFISVITIAELQLGVLAAKTTSIRSARMITLESVGVLEYLAVDAAAAAHWARLRVRLAEEGRRANVNDLWIAAIAAANNLPIVTRDADFDAISDVGGPAVIRV